MGSEPEALQEGVGLPRDEPAQVRAELVGEFTFLERARHLREASTRAARKKRRSLPEGIVSGPDGALWFTEFAPGKIGRVTTSGSFTEYQLSTGAESCCLAVGPDGAIWVTQYGADTPKITRVTTAGQLTAYLSPNQSFPQNLAEIFAATSVATGITAGPDGALWFVSQTGFMTRVTTSGVYSGYETVSAGVGPAYAVVAGPDGALWFTEPTLDLIGRMTTAGSLHTYAAPSPNGDPGAIVVGPDHNLWVTETGKIAQMILH